MLVSALAHILQEVHTHRVSFSSKKKKKEEGTIVKIRGGNIFFMVVGDRKLKNRPFIIARLGSPSWLLWAGTGAALCGHLFLLICLYRHGEQCS